MVWYAVAEVIFGSSSAVIRRSRTGIGMASLRADLFANSATDIKQCDSPCLQDRVAIHFTSMPGDMASSPAPGMRPVVRGFVRALDEPLVWLQGLGPLLWKVAVP